MKTERGFTCCWNFPENYSLFHKVSSLAAPILGYLSHQHSLQCPSAAVIDGLRMAALSDPPELLQFDSLIIYYELMSLISPLYGRAPNWFSWSYVLVTLLLSSIRDVRGPSKIQLILIVCEVSICQFICSLKCICNPQINTHGAFVVIHGHAEQRKCQVAWGAHFSQLRLDKWCSIISVQLLLQTSVLFLVCLVPGFFLHWWVHCLWCPHTQCHHAAWCSWRKKALKCFAEKICVLDELCSGLRYSDCWPWVQCQGINNMY